MKEAFDQLVPNGTTGTLWRIRRGSGSCISAGAVWLAASLAAWSAPGLAEAGAGSSSSTSISISVSVAAQHRLRAVDGPTPADEMKRSGAGSYCIETNGEAMPLPVALVWPATRADYRAPSVESVAELPTCGTPQARIALPNGELAARMVIVRPE